MEYIGKKQEIVCTPTLFERVIDLKNVLLTLLDQQIRTRDDHVTVVQTVVMVRRHQQEYGIIDMVIIEQGVSQSVLNQFPLLLVCVKIWVDDHMRDVRVSQSRPVKVRAGVLGPQQEYVNNQSLIKKMPSNPRASFCFSLYLPLTNHLPCDQKRIIRFMPVFNLFTSLIKKIAPLYPKSRHLRKLLQLFESKEMIIPLIYLLLRFPRDHYISPIGIP